MIDPLTQALLAGPLQSWNGGSGEAVLLSFSFAADTASAAGPASVGFSPLQQQAARDALAAWTPGTGLAFVEVPDQPGGTGIDLRFRLEQLDPWWINGEASLAPQGDIALNLRFYRQDPLRPGQSGYESLLHEIGHALGLKHSFEGAVTLPAALDSRDTTLMAYARVADGFATAPQALDHAAVRALYGAAPVAGQASWDAAAGRVRIAGTAADEVLRGTALDDLIFGGGGKDQLLGRDGDDLLRPGDLLGHAEGGAGFDRLWLDVARSEVALALQIEPLGQARTTGRQGEAGALSFAGIESLRFLDGDLAFDAADPVAMAARLHLAATGLQASAAMLGILVDAAEPAAAALALPAAATTAVLPDAAFLAQLYATLLQRAPDAEGLAYWLGRLDQGQDRAAILHGIAGGAEAMARQDLPAAGIWAADPQALAVQRLYHATLGRDVEAEGLRWGMDLLDRQAGAKLAEALLDSAEFTGRHGHPTPTALVLALYAVALGRAPDAEAASWWHDQLSAGSLDAAHFALALAASTEFQARDAGSWGAMLPG